MDVTAGRRRQALAECGECIVPADPLLQVGREMADVVPGMRGAHGKRPVAAEDNAVGTDDGDQIVETGGIVLFLPVAVAERLLMPWGAH